MKKISILVLSLMTMPVYSQSILSTLNQYQGSLKPAENANSKPNTPDVKPSSESVASTSTKCEENDQTSIPLAYLSSLILEKDGAVNISHNPRDGVLTVNTPSMISNCSSMIEWRLKKPEIQGQKAYAVEAVIKKGDVCNSDGSCAYKVARMEKGDFKEFQNLSFRPTLKGFEECLQQSGVIAGGKVVPDAIYAKPAEEKFPGLNYSGKLLFLSHGPTSPIIKPKFGKFEFQNGCDFYENPAAQPTVLLTLDDAEKQRLDAEAAKLRECKVDEYQKLTDFIDKYQSYSDELGQVRDRLILEAVKKAAENIGKGKYTSEDLKVIADFNEFIVGPKVDLASALYEESLELDGDAKAAKLEELKAVRAQLSALLKAPYFVPANISKLMQDGKFDDATNLNAGMLLLQNYSNVGQQIDNVMITPGVASQKTVQSKKLFAQTIALEKLKYQHRTGEVNTEPARYAAIASEARARIQANNAEAAARIQEQMELIQQPNGHCYKYWINTQRCVSEAQQTMSNYVNWLQQENAKQVKIATDADAQAKEWGALAYQGRRYVAAQNGVELPETDPTPQTPTPTPQTNTNFYNFGAQGQQGQQQPGMQQPGQQQPYFNYQAAMQSFQQYQQPQQQNNMFQQQQNPYAPYMGGQQQQYNPFMGQQNYGYQPQSPYGYNQYQGGAQFGMNFGIGNQSYGYQAQQYSPYGGYQQPQQPYSYGAYQQQPYAAAANNQASYWYRPYQAYNQYSMYGR